MLWTDTNQSNNVRLKDFYTDSLLHLTTFSTTFNSKRLSWSITLPGQTKTSTFSATILKVTRGIDVKESRDPYISPAELALSGPAERANEAGLRIDIFPLSRFVPSWVPGASFQKKAARWEAALITMTEESLQYLKEQLVKDYFLDSQGSCELI